MNIVKSGTTLRVYGGSVRLMDRLEPRCYRYCYSDMGGPYLEEAPAPTAPGFRVYGDHASRVGVAFDAYRRRKGVNTGVLLSGAKGIGKTLVARLMALRALEEGVPVLLVDTCLPGLVEYIGSIDQDLMVLFDEFEKMFPDERDGGASEQERMLALFDGVSQGHKLFVATCNDVGRICDCLLNRPGRIRYHFRFGFPGPGEIRGYLRDRLGRKAGRAVVDKVVKLAGVVPMTYDILSAVAEELSFGRTLEDALAVLNVTSPEDQKFKVVVHGTCDGAPVAETVDAYEAIDLVHTDESGDLHTYIVHASGPDYESASIAVGRIVITPRSVGRAEYDHAANRFRIPAEALKFQEIPADGGKRRHRYVLDCVMLYPMAGSVWNGNRSLAVDPRAL